MVPGPTTRTLVLIGGDDGQGTSNGQDYLSTFYQLSCNEEDDISCEWQLMQQQLEVARSQHVAMCIPNSLTTCN